MTTDINCIFSVNCSFYDKIAVSFFDVLGWFGVCVCASSVEISDF